jgi:uncharacterized membrane protein
MAFADALNMQQQTTAASIISQIAASVALSSRSQVGALIDFGPYAGNAISSEPPIQATVSAFYLLAGAAQMSNGKNQMHTSLATSLPGLLNVDMQLSIGERAVGSGFVAIGKVGATVHTAQMRLQLNLQTGISGQTAIQVPLYLEIANATARLASVRCDNIGPAVSLGVTPGVVDAWIGQVATRDLTNFESEPVVSAAPIVTLGPISLSGLAHANSGNVKEALVGYSAQDISTKTIKSTTTQDYTATLFASLFGQMQLFAAIGGGQLAASPATQAVSQSLAGVSGSLDQLLAIVLSSLGISIGNADSWVSGAACRAATLVN